MLEDTEIELPVLKTREDQQGRHQAMLKQHRLDKSYRKEDHKKGFHRMKFPCITLK
jgi:hypothetical protein